MGAELAKKWNIQEYLPENVVIKDPDKISRIEKVLAKYDKGQLYTVVMTCRGLKHCPYQADCPVKEHLSAIQGEKCPLERLQQEKWFDEYCEAFKVDPKDTVKLNDVKQLVQLDLQIMRANQIIANEGFEQTVVTETEDGKKYEKKLHNVANLLDKLETRRLKLLQQLDRPSFQINAADPSTYIALLKKKYITAQEQE